MSLADRGMWINVAVKVSKEKANEADPWEPPAPADVATEIRERLEGVDLDTGWVISKVSS